MSAPKLTIDDSVLPNDLARIIAACEHFEADWNAGRPRRIEMRRRVRRLRGRLFRELLALEFELCRRSGPTTRLGTISPAFPTRLTSFATCSAARPSRCQTRRPVWPRRTINLMLRLRI